MAQQKRPEIKQTVRHGNAVYLKGNEEHAEMLADALSGRQCLRLLDNDVVAGKPFSDKAKAYEKEEAEAAEALRQQEEAKRERQQSQRPWAHPPGAGNTSTEKEAPKKASKKDDKE